MRASTLAGLLGGQHGTNNLERVAHPLLQEMRVEMAKQWRGGQTRADKLRGSLAARVPRSWPPEVAALFLDKAQSTVLAAWAAAPPPRPPPTRVGVSGFPLMQAALRFLCLRLASRPVVGAPGFPYF